MSNNAIVIFIIICSVVILALAWCFWNWLNKACEIWSSPRGDPRTPLVVGVLAALGVALTVFITADCTLLNSWYIENIRIKTPPNEKTPQEEELKILLLAGSKSSPSKDSHSKDSH